MREAELQEIDASELVPGDVIVLRAGDQAPADARVVSSTELRVAEAALTGESLPVEKDNAPVDSDTPLADRSSMIYSSTLVTNGSGKAVVTATGNATEIGKISKLVSEAEVLATPLTKRVNRFSHFLLVAILAMAVLVVIFGISKGQPPVEMFKAAVALAVGAIPEGLPAALTITLAMGVSRMARRKAIIRKLPAVETLGSTSVICSDKTGTLTQNEMTVTVVYAGGERFEVSGVGYEPAGELTRAHEAVQLQEHTALEACIRAGFLCNDSRHVEEDGRCDVLGDPTEGAMLVLAKKAGAPISEWAQQYPRLGEIPFESEHKYMATLHDSPDGEPVILLKGAVERVLERCQHALGSDGREERLDPETIHAEADAMANEGLRVLALAVRSEQPGTTTLDGRTSAADSGSQDCRV
jgi:Ca2+-transporting ATPase